MTKNEAIQRVINLAKSKLGYHEGTNNANCFATDSNVIQAIGWNAANQPWCVIFIVYLFVTAFGLIRGCKVLRTSVGKASAAVEGMAKPFQDAGATGYTPQAGALVCYRGMGHIGLCVTDSPLTCIDGNYSDSVKFHYNPSTDAILYLYPDWDVVVSETDTETETDSETFAVGDWVTVREGARDYSNMNALNHIVFENEWKIRYLNKDRAILGVNRAGDHDIMTPVHTADLVKVESETISTSETETTASSENSSNSNLSEVPTSSNVVVVETANTTMAQAFGIGQQMASHYQQNSATDPVIVNNTASAIHAFGGKLTNVQERNK